MRRLPPLLLSTSQFPGRCPLLLLSLCSRSVYCSLIALSEGWEAQLWMRARARSDADAACSRSSYLTSLGLNCLICEMRVLSWDLVPG